METYEILVLVFMALMTFNILSRFRISNLQLETKYKIETLRNNVRARYYAGEINPSKASFQKLDDALAMLCRTLPRLSLLHFVYLMFSSKHKYNYAAIQKFESAMKEDPALNEVYHQSMRIALAFLRSRNIITLGSLRLSMRFLNMFVRLFKKAGVQHSLRLFPSRFKYTLIHGETSF